MSSISLIVDDRLWFQSVIQTGDLLSFLQILLILMSSLLARKIRVRYWSHLGNILPEFVYFAVENCHRATLPSATLNFLVGKNFANQPKHQTCRRAWVGQADFRKVEINNRNHSGNCQRFSVKHETRST